MPIRSAATLALRSKVGPRPPRATSPSRVWHQTSANAPLLEPEPVIYLPTRLAAPATAAIIVRGTAQPEVLTRQLREEVRALDPDLPLYRVLTMEQALWEAGSVGRVSNRLASTITVVALVLALVGLYAVTAQGVTQRTAEIGIRTALGASPGQTVWLVLRQAIARLTVGIALGFGCTLAWERLFGDATAIANRATDPSDVRTSRVLADRRGDAGVRRARSSGLPHQSGGRPSHRLREHGSRVRPRRP